MKLWTIIILSSILHVQCEQDNTAELLKKIVKEQMEASEERTNTLMTTLVDKMMLRITHTEKKIMQRIANTEQKIANIAEKMGKMDEIVLKNATREVVQGNLFECF